MIRPSSRAAIGLIFIFASALQGCAKSKNNSVIVPPVPNRVETRVYLRPQCLLGEEKVVPVPRFAAALAAIFVPALIEKGLDAVSTALKKAGSEETLRDSGKYPTYFYRLSYDDKTKKGKLSLNPSLGCAAVVRGRFSGPDPDEEQTVVFPEPGLFLGADEEPKRIKRLNANNIPVMELVAEYESAISTADDGTALNFESRFLEMKGFQGTRSSDSRAVVVSLTFYGVGAKEDETTLSLALLDLGEVKRGSVLGPAELRSRRSGWLGSLSASDASLKAAERLSPTPDKSFGIMPVTLEGMLIETEKGSKALLFIADVLSSTKSDTAKALTSAILPEERKKNAQEQANALEKQHEDEEDAYGKYLAALDELAQLNSDAPASTKAIKQFNVGTAKRIWCLKFSVLQNLGIAPSNRPSCT